jgi:hypothetical protein
MSPVLPPRALGHQAASYGAHLSTSLCAPVRQTHLASITSLNTFPIYVTPFGSFPRRYCFCVMSALFVFLILYYFVYLLKHSLPELASQLSAHIVIQKLI